MPPEPGDVSVIIPAYRTAGTIERALASVAAQTVRPREVIVVDDGSDDGTVDVARAYAERLHGIEVNVVHQDHAGAGAARNRALRDARATYVAFLDADDEWQPDKIARSLAVMDETGSDLVSHDYTQVANGGEKAIHCARHFADAADVLGTYFLRGYIATSTVVARRELIARAGGFDPGLLSGQDYELWLAVLCMPDAQIHVFPESLTRYHVTPHSISSLVERRRRAALAIVYRYAPKLRRRKATGMALIWLRVLIIHGQAAAAHRHRRNFLGMLAAILELPASLVAATAASYRAARPRRDFLSEPPASKPCAESGPVNPFITTRGTAEKIESAQGRNRVWWETQPMTYADWTARDRLPASTAALTSIEEQLISLSPYLRERFDFSAFVGQRVLDLGCGSGALSCRFARHGAEVSAIDLTQQGVELANANARAQGLPVDVARVDAEALCFANASFDYVFSWGVLHHTRDIGAAIQEMGRVMKLGGHGLMMVYHRPSVVYNLHGLYWLLVKGKLFQGYTLRSVQDFYTDGYFHRYMTKAELGGLLADARLKVSRFTVTQYQKKILPLVPHWLDEWLKARFGMCLIAEFEKVSS